MRRTTPSTLTALAVVAVLALTCTGCARRVRVTDAMVKSVSIGTAMDRVIETLGPPQSRGRKVTLKTEGSITKEYPRKAEACLWQGEHTYVLVFWEGELAGRQAFIPERTEVSVSEVPDGDIRDGDSVQQTMTKGVVYGEVEL